MTLTFLQKVAAGTAATVIGAAVVAVAREAFPEKTIFDRFPPMDTIKIKFYHGGQGGGEGGSSQKTVLGAGGGGVGGASKRAIVGDSTYGGSGGGVSGSSDFTAKIVESPPQRSRSMAVKSAPVFKFKAGSSFLFRGYKLSFGAQFSVENVESSYQSLSVAINAPPICKFKADYHNLFNGYKLILGAQIHQSAVEMHSLKKPDQAEPSQNTKNV